MNNLTCRGHSTHGGNCAGAVHYLRSSEHGGVPTELCMFCRRSVSEKNSGTAKKFPQNFILGRFNKPDDTLQFLSKKSEKRGIPY